MDSRINKENRFKQKLQVYCSISSPFCILIEKLESVVKCSNSKKNRLLNMMESIILLGRLAP